MSPREKIRLSIAECIYCNGKMLTGLGGVMYDSQKELGVVSSCSKCGYKIEFTNRRRR
jgi:DNA-directed RNA polymerase subunit M/transcription elongation factor TFIIS